MEAEEEAEAEAEADVETLGDPYAKRTPLPSVPIP